MQYVGMPLSWVDFYEQGFVFYRQNWSVLDDQYYGNEGFGLCGCGPTCIAAIISNLAGVPVDPEEMRVYGLSVGDLCSCPDDLSVGMNGVLEVRTKTLKLLNGILP